MGNDPQTSVAEPVGRAARHEGRVDRRRQRVPDLLGHQPDDLDHGARAPHRRGDRRRARAGADRARQAAASATHRSRPKEHRHGSSRRDPGTRQALHRRRVGRPRRRRDDRRHQRHHRGGHGHASRRARRRTSTARSRPRARRSRRWSQTDARGARRAACARSPPGWPRAARRSPRTIAQELGMPIGLSTAIQAGLPTMTFGSMPQLLERGRVGGGGRQLAGRARAGRRGRRDHAVELPAAPDRREGRAGARGRLHGRAEAERGRAAERVHPRRDHRRGRRCRPACSTSSPGTGPVVGEAIAAHPGVDMVSFTGSTRAGQARQRAGRRRRSSAVALELGGKSPNVILDDADLETAVTDGVAKCFLNSGQTCSALTRMLVPRERLEEAEQIAAGGRRGLHGRRPVRREHAARAAGLRRRSASACAATSSKGIEEGARLVTGGAEPPEGLERGYFVQPDGVLRGDATT